MTSSDIDRHVKLGRSVHRWLDDLLAGKHEEGLIVASGSTRLPDWTVGHLLTHIARNADSHRRLIEGADRGEVLEQYAGGPAERAAEIEADANRDPSDLIADVRVSSAALEATWSTTAWKGAGRGGGSQNVKIVQLPFLRIREVQLHAVDLDIGIGFDDLDPFYVRMEIDRLTMLWCARRPMGMTNLPTAALELRPHARLAWLSGRRVVDGLDPPDLL